MSNQLASLPWSVDTPATLTTNKIFVSEFIYSGYQNATDAVEIQDRDGKLVAYLSGKTDLSPVSSGYIKTWAAGLVIPTLTSVGGGGFANIPSGVLFIHVR